MPKFYEELSHRDTAVCLRRVGTFAFGLGDSKYLDIRTFVHTKDLLGTPPINPKSKLFASEDFYARTELPGWTYEAMSVEQYTEKYYGGKLPPATRKFSGEFPVHVWSTRNL